MADPQETSRGPRGPVSPAKVPFFGWHNFCSRKPKGMAQADSCLDNFLGLPFRISGDSIDWAVPKLGGGGGVC